MLKEVYFLESYLKYLFEVIPFKYHRKILYLMRFIIVKYSIGSLYSLKVKGFFFKVKGKISAGGNSRKKTYLIKFADCGFNNMNKRVKYYSFPLWTIVGTLGVKLAIVY